ncbi:MAG: hypothetical protein EGQ09_14590 [Clostridiales bacterium]|nr:hypothetical protein [Clostridiales bacterium]
MEQYAIKSVAFGGFDKEDVARYIEQISQESGKLREERDVLQERLEQAEQEMAALRDQLQALTEAKERLEAENQRLAPMEAENARLKEEMDALRPDAEAHVMLREQVGTIECEARQRAAELEERTVGQMRRATDQFRRQYQVLMNTVETASGHMTAELRKMEVALAQLPRTMDQTGVELNQLAAALEKTDRSEGGDKLKN